MKICSEQGCSNKLYAKGVCRPHYNLIKPALKCSVTDCNNPKHCKGMCAKHYTRQVRYGDVNRIGRTGKRVANGAIPSCERLCANYDESLFLRSFKRESVTNDGDTHYI